MKKRILSSLMAMVMLLALLPATALATEETSETTGYKLSYVYPEDLCSFSVYDWYDADKTPIENGGTLPINASTNRAYGVFEIENIASGYRIKSVDVNGADRTYGFIDGAYGGMAMTIRTDTTVTVELEEIPDPLATISAVSVTDQRSKPVSSILTDEDSWLYANVTYSDAESYPDHFASCVWEFSLDHGNTWTEMPGWGTHTNLNIEWDWYESEYGINFMTLQDYSLRVAATPRKYYSQVSGGAKAVYSEPVAVNTSSCSHVWDEGKVTLEATDYKDGVKTYTCSTCGGTKIEAISASGSSTGLHKLSAPTDLTWGRYYQGNTSGDYYECPGMISWVVSDTAYTHTNKVTVYKDGEKVFNTGWRFRPEEGPYWTDWDFSLSIIEKEGSGTYYYTVQAKGDGTTTADSDIATSPEFVYTMPDEKLAVPTGLKWTGSTATWDAVDDERLGGYVIRIYYSADNAAPTSVDELERVDSWVQYTFDEAGCKTSFDVMDYVEESQEGYYYFTVKTVSADITDVMHSGFSDLSPAYHYTSGTSAEPVPAVTDAYFTQYNGEPQTWLCFDFADGADLSHIQYLEIQLYQNGWKPLADISPRENGDLLEALLESSDLSGTFGKIRFISHGGNGYADSTYEKGIDLTVTRNTDSTAPASAVYTDNGNGTYNVAVSGLHIGKMFSISTQSAASYDSKQVLMSLGFSAAENTTAQFNGERPMSSHPLASAYYQINEYESVLKSSVTCAITITDVSGWQQVVLSQEPQPEEPFSGLRLDADGVWRYYVNDVFQSGYTGLVQHVDGNFYYVASGAIDFTYTGLVDYYGTSYYVQGGILYWGVYGLLYVDGAWRYLYNSTFASNFTGLVEYGDGSRFYVVNGLIDFGYTGLVPDTDGKYYYIISGLVRSDHTGLVQHTDGYFYYVINGVVESSYTGLVPYGELSYYVQGGILYWGVYGLVPTNGAWYYIYNSAAATNYTGLVEHTDSNLYYVEAGTINWGYAGLVWYADGNWYYVSGGAVDSGYTGLALHSDGYYYYINSGVVDTSYTGLVEYGGMSFYVQGGVLYWGIEGLVTVDGEMYYLYNSTLASDYSGTVLHTDGKYYQVVNGVVIAVVE